MRFLAVRFLSRLRCVFQSPLLVARRPSQDRKSCMVPNRFKYQHRFALCFTMETGNWTTDEKILQERFLIYIINISYQTKEAFYNYYEKSNTFLFYLGRKHDCVCRGSCRKGGGKEKLYGFAKFQTIQKSKCKCKTI